MTTPVLIGVGGTGQTVLAAYLRLATLAGFTPARFYVIDSDTKGPLGTTVTGLRGGVEEVAGGGKISHRWMIDPFPASDAERSTFGGLFGHLVGQRRQLFDCLFSQEAEQTPIRKGMYGRPSIGATCIRHKLLKDDDELKELRDSLRGGSKHIVLVGSCFGGTGSGGVPMLASEFARLGKEDGYDLRVDAVIYLPWFRLVLKPGDVRSEDRTLHERLNEIFEPNAAAGILYFKKELREHVESLILLGMSDPGSTTRVSNESQQEETVHPLNLLAAMLIQNHFSGALDPPRGISGYWFDPEAGLRQVAVHRKGDGALSLLQVAYRAYLARHWLGILSKLFRNFTQIPPEHQPLLLTSLLERFRGALRSDDQVAEEIADRLAERQKIAEESLEWLKKMHEADGRLFPLDQEQIEIRWDTDYERLTADPLKVVTVWSDDEGVLSRFQPEDLGSTEHFSDRLAELFLTHLMNELGL